MPNRRCVVYLLLVTSAIFIENIYAISHIEWEPVKGADHYQIEVLRDGQHVLTAQSKETKLPVVLPPGEYEFKVNIIDPFGNVALSSEWSPLIIIPPLPPLIIGFTPQELYEGEETTFTSRVIGYIEHKKNRTIFHLENSRGKKIPLEIETAGKQVDEELTWTKISLQLMQEKLSRGNWDLVMTNPQGKSNRMKEALIVLKHIRPKVKKVTPHSILAGNKYNQVILKVIKMEKDASIRFHGPSDIDGTLLRIKKNNRLLYSLNLENAEPGWYAVTINNPSGQSHTRNKAFKVENPTGLNPIMKHPIIKPPHSLFMGYAMNFPIGDEDIFFKYKFVGFGIGFSQSFHNTFLNQTPQLKGFGWELNLQFFASERVQFIIDDTDVYHFAMIIGLRYITPFHFPLNILLRVGAGLSYSLYNSPYISRQDDIGDYTLEDIDSIDGIWRFGAGIQIDFSSRFFANLTLDAHCIFYSYKPVWFLQPRLETGYKW